MDLGFFDGDHLTMVAPLETHLESPAEHGHLEPRERKDRPEALQRESAGESERGNREAYEEPAGAAGAQRAVRSNFDAMRESHGAGW